MEISGVVKTAAEVARTLEDLAAEINAEHRRSAAAQTTALDHALRAGELLAETKGRVKHGQWGQWLEENFEGSIRTAQIYMLLTYRRADIEEEKALRAKTQSSAHLSIAEALHFLRPGGRHTPTEQQLERQRKARERERQQLFAHVEFAIRSGNQEPPAGVEIPRWQQAFAEWVAMRPYNLPLVLEALAHELGVLANHSSPEGAAEWLARPMGFHFEKRYRELWGSRELAAEDAAMDAAVLIAELRAGAEWLDRVLAEVDRRWNAEALDEHLERSPALEGEPQQTDDPHAE